MSHPDFCPRLQLGVWDLEINISMAEGISIDSHLAGISFQGAREAQRATFDLELIVIPPQFPNCRRVPECWLASASVDPHSHFDGASAPTSATAPLPALLGRPLIRVYVGLCVLPLLLTAVALTGRGGYGRAVPHRRKLPL